MKTSRLIGAVMTPLGKAFVHVGRYPGGAVAVELRSCKEEQMGELTTDLVPIGARIATDEFWVKTWGDNMRIVHPMLDSELFEDTGKVESTGHAFAPIWRIRHPEHVPPTARRRSPAACPGPAARAEHANACGSHKSCCVCGEENLAEEECAFGACADCLDNINRDPEAFVARVSSVGGCVLRTYAGSKGDVDAAYPTLKAAIAAFNAAPINSRPRVVRDGTIVVELNREFEPTFHDAEARRIHREMFGGFLLRSFMGFGKGDVDLVYPTLDAAIEAFAVAPVDSVPRVLHDGKTIVGLDPEGGLTPVFGDAEAESIYRRIVSRCATAPADSKP